MKLLFEFCCAAAFVLLTTSLVHAQAGESHAADALSPPRPDSTAAGDPAVPPPPADSAPLDVVPAPHPGPTQATTAPLSQQEMPPEALGPRPHPVGAAFAELGLGIGGMAVGLSLTVAAINIGYDHSDALFVIGLTVGPILTLGLTGLGIYGGGRMTSGEGSYWWTALGVVVGASLGAGVGYGLVGVLSSDVGIVAGSLLTPALALAGGMFAFERSDRAVRRRSAGPLPIPMVAATPGGLTLGLAGRF